MYIIVKMQGNVEEVQLGIEGDKAQVIAKLKGADPGMEVLDGDAVILAGEMYSLRPLLIALTKDNIRDKLMIPEPVHV